MPLSVVSLAVLGGCQVLYYATTNTLIQVLAPARLRGRVMSLYILPSWGLIPVGNVLAGVVAQQWTPTVALVGGAVVTLVTSLAVALLFPAIRRLEAGSAASPGTTQVAAGDSGRDAAS